MHLFMKESCYSFVTHLSQSQNKPIEASSPATLNNLAPPTSNPSNPLPLNTPNPQTVHVPHFLLSQHLQRHLHLSHRGRDLHPAHRSPNRRQHFSRDRHAF